MHYITLKVAKYSNVQKKKISVYYMMWLYCSKSQKNAKTRPSDNFYLS